MANNIWSNYTEKTATPVDADEVMVRDSTDGKNKRLLFGTFWKWVAKKLNEATISELQTSSKTIIGAINALNSESFLLSQPKKILDSTDLNTVMNPGTYIIKDTCLNFPGEQLSRGILVVLLPENKNYPRQIYFGGYLSNIYTRVRFYSGDSFKWSDWREI